jgi:hypothetical protein
MSPICPADGHLIEEPEGAFCPDHGVPWFDNCQNCGALWTAGRTSPENYFQTAGDDFCAACGMPAPWVSRDRLIRWIRHQIQADKDIPGATRLELLAVLERLEAMKPDDTKTVAGWEQIKKAAPNVWESVKPVIQTVVGEGVKKALGL